MNDDDRLSPLGAEMVAGMSAFLDAAESGQSIEERYTIRSYTLDLESRPYGPADVKDVRKYLNASQSLLAKFLGVSVKTLRSWEQGTRPVPRIACRYLDDVVAHPEVWRDRVKLSAPAPGGGPARSPE